MPVLIKHTYPEPLVTKAQYFLESILDMDKTFTEDSELSVRADIAMCIVCGMNFYQCPAGSGSDSKLVIVEGLSEMTINIESEEDANSNPTSNQSV